MRLSVLILNIFLLLSFTSCHASERDAVLDTVKKYNETLIKVYRTLDYMSLQDYATLDEINRIFPVVQTLLNKNSIMVAEQRSFKVKKVDIMGDTAQVETEEEWYYYWQEKKTGAITKLPQNIFYKIVYQLKKVDSRWKIDSLKEAGK